MLLTKEKGKVTTETNKLRTKPSKKKAADKRPQIIHKASLTVNNQIIPSRLNSNMKPNGHLNERQKKKKKVPNAPSASQNS